MTRWTIVQQHGIEHSQEPHKLCLLQDSCQRSRVIFLITEYIIHPVWWVEKLKVKEYSLTCNSFATC